MLKKIGILSFQRTTNYGAQYQNYALFKYLSNYSNLDVSVIDYDNETVNAKEKNVYLKDQKGFKDLIKYLIVGRSKKIKWNNFEKFRKYNIKYSSSFNKNSITNVSNIYDFYLVGSDQIWNTEITGNDYNYFLNFESDNRKKYTYAVSIGNENLLDENKKVLDYIKNFQNVYTREESLLKKLKENGIEKVKTVVDPTFLLSKEEWILNLNLKENKPNKKYILVYMIDNPKKNIKRIKNFAKKNKLDVIYINTELMNYFGVINNRTASPYEFLNLLMNAEYIITGSFHAICLSLIFNKNFAYILNSKLKRNNRIIDLLNALDVNENNITNKENIELQELDYRSINSLLKNMINLSKEYIDVIVKEWK